MHPLRQNKSRLHGFTMLEMAVVISVVALIIGAVLGGTTLMESARMRKDIATLDRINGMVNLFRQRYNYLPGDVPNATTLWPGTAEVLNGDGNGRIFGGSIHAGIDPAIQPANYPDGELYYVWDHLARSGISGYATYNEASGDTMTNGVHTPVFVSLEKMNATSCFGNAGAILFSFDGKNYIRMGSITCAGVVDPMAPFLFDYIYRPRVAEEFDRKIDDGWPGTGKVTTTASANYYWNYSNYISPGAHWTQQYCGGEADANGRYPYNKSDALWQQNYDSINKPTIACGMRVEANF